MAEPPSSSSNNKLHGKVAIVTGGASGIGEATARRFAEHGARAVIIADIQDEKGRNVASSIGGPNKCTYVRCDVTDEEQVKALIESTVRNYGRLDVMFSNAGVARTFEQTVLDLDLTAYDRLFAVNARGMAACVKHAARAMVEGQVRGSVICTASLAASTGHGTSTDYVMSKHAVLGLVRSASMQLAKHGIRVNAVSPGVVATPLLRAALGIGDEEEADLSAVLESKWGLKGTVMTGKNIADAVVFLASEDSEFVTGHDLVVNGIL